MKTPPAIRRFIEEFLKIDEEAVGKGSVNRALQEAMREEGVSDPGVFENGLCHRRKSASVSLMPLLSGKPGFFATGAPLPVLRAMRGIAA